MLGISGLRYKIKKMLTEEIIHLKDQHKDSQKPILPSSMVNSVTTITIALSMKGKF